MNTEDTSANEYLLLFRGQDWDHNMDAAKTRQILESTMEWFESVHREGKALGTHALERGGCVVSGKHGKIVTDGPFAESKEAIGGYLLLRAASLQEAIAIAQRCPTLEFGISVEVRPTLGECPIAKRLRERELEAVS